MDATIIWLLTACMAGLAGGFLATAIFQHFRLDDTASCPPDDDRPDWPDPSPLPPSDEVRREECRRTDWNAWAEVQNARDYLSRPR